MHNMDPKKVLDILFSGESKRPNIYAPLGHTTTNGIGTLVIIVCM